ncbi:methyltransferase domain-containing protein [bacterium]|nr:methyltransferase domain-containing protein [bacterium]
MTARQLALKALLNWQKDKESHLEQHIKGNIPPKDLDLAYNICRGVLKEKSFLKATLKRYLKKDKLPKATETILLIAAYQMLFLDKVPGYAAVNEAVKLAKQKTPAYASLVNAVLRNLDRDIKEGFDPRKQDLPLAERYSHPQELIDLINAETKDQALTEQILIWDNAKPKTFLRLKNGSHEECLDVKAAVNSPEFKQGEIYFMQLWSQSVANAAPVKDGDKVLDLCAAPGGKSLALLDRAKIKLTACDFSESRLAQLKENFARMGYATDPGITIKQLDARAANQEFPPESFDLVLLDAPCSSLGTIQRNPELRWRFKIDQLAEYAALQKSILSAAKDLVAPKGHLLYAVCSFAKAEREAADLLRQDKNWILKEEKLTYPGEQNLFDGGYYALFQKKS